MVGQNIVLERCVRNYGGKSTGSPRSRVSGITLSSSADDGYERDLGFGNSDACAVQSKKPSSLETSIRHCPRGFLEAGA